MLSLVMRGPEPGERVKFHGSPALSALRCHAALVFDRFAHSDEQTFRPGSNSRPHSGHRRSRGLPSVWTLFNRRPPCVMFRLASDASFCDSGSFASRAASKRRQSGDPTRSRAFSPFLRRTMSHASGSPAASS